MKVFHYYAKCISTRGHEVELDGTIRTDAQGSEPGFLEGVRKSMFDSMAQAGHSPKSIDTVIIKSLSVIYDGD